jgi:molybdopterin-guanine dinucleotide biosynthesis protein A
MGRPKATLPFGPELMLQRVVRLVRQAVEPVIVVAAAGQDLPALPSPTVIVRDQRPERGPLEGLAAGLHALKDRAEAAYVTACDVPLLVPAFVRRVVELLTGYEAAVPHVDGFDEPLSAAYRTDVLPHVQALLAAERLRPVFLFEHVRTRRITPAELTDVDPQLDSLANVNSPADYQAALKKAGFMDTSGSEA